MMIDCGAFEEFADELALSLLTGVDRAAALAHLDECHSCRAMVASLTDVADEILLLAPSSPPDDGFERRVLARIGPVVEPRSQTQSKLRQSRRRRLRALAAAAVVAIALVVVGMFARVESATSTQVADMRTRGGEVVGTVAVHEGGPTLIDMRLPGWQSLLHSYTATTPARYWLDVSSDDGERQHVALDPVGDGSWKVAAGAALDIASVAVVDAHGDVWCSARFA